MEKPKFLSFRRPNGHNEFKEFRKNTKDANQRNQSCYNN